MSPGAHPGRTPPLTRRRDALYQVTREQRDGDNSYDITYTYDAGRNRLTKTDAGDTTTYSYDAANHLSTGDDGTAVAAEWHRNSARRKKGAAGRLWAILST